MKGVLRSKSLRTAAIIHSKLQAWPHHTPCTLTLCSSHIKTFYFPQYVMLAPPSCQRPCKLICNCLPAWHHTKKGLRQNKDEAAEGGHANTKAQKKTHGWWLFFLQCYVQISFLEAHLNSYVYLKTVSPIILLSLRLLIQLTYVLLFNYLFIMEFVSTIYIFSLFGSKWHPKVSGLLEIWI